MLLGRLFTYFHFTDRKKSLMNLEVFQLSSVNFVWSQKIKWHQHSYEATSYRVIMTLVFFFLFIFDVGLLFENIQLLVLIEVLLRSTSQNTSFHIFKLLPTSLRIWDMSVTRLTFILFFKNQQWQLIGVGDNYMHFHIWKHQY